MSVIQLLSASRSGFRMPRLWSEYNWERMLKQQSDFAESCKKGGQEAIAILLLDIAEIKIVIDHGGQSSCVHAFDDCGSDMHDE
jgi:hypothetical protein